MTESSRNGSDFSDIWVRSSNCVGRSEGNLILEVLPFSNVRFIDGFGFSSCQNIQISCALVENKGRPMFQKRGNITCKMEAAPFFCISADLCALPNQVEKGNTPRNNTLPGTRTRSVPRTRRELATAPAWVLSRGIEMAKTENRKPMDKKGPAS